MVPYNGNGESTGDPPSTYSLVPAFSDVVFMTAVIAQSLRPFLLQAGCNMYVLIVNFGEIPMKFIFAELIMAYLPLR